MKQALLIIDVQNDYFPGGRSELFQPLAALENIEKLLRHFRDHTLPVIHVQHVNTLEGAAFFLPDTEGVLVHKNLTPRQNESLVVKHQPSSFFETNLLEIIKSDSITGLVICGMMSHMCVDTTTRACKDYGVNVILIDDACATKTLAWRGKSIPADTVHDVFMASLNGIFAKVMGADEFLASEHRGQSI